MACGLPPTSLGGSMRHRFHSISPYFAMFPETFVQKHLAASRHAGVVFDPFCGRGTAMFQALLDDRDAAGCDVNPVAVCISAAKCDPPTQSQVESRIRDLRQNVREPPDRTWRGDLGGFFELCFHRHTLQQVLYLRSVLDWRNRKDDRFIAALCLGALHGESHRSPNYFSNRMPRTISTKPDYSLRWWQRHGHTPPARDVFEILERMTAYRFRTPPPRRAGTVVESDARCAGDSFPFLAGRVTDVITSPPYLNTTNYREDQWLRLWFLGGPPLVPYDHQDDRYVSKEAYWKFLHESWAGLSPLLAKEVRIVIRIGGRQMKKGELRGGLLGSLTDGLTREVRLIDNGVTSEIATTQSNSFRGVKASRLEEHDFCFTV